MSFKCVKVLSRSRHTNCSTRIAKMHSRSVFIWILSHKDCRPCRRTFEDAARKCPATGALYDYGDSKITMLRLPNSRAFGRRTDDYEIENESSALVSVGVL